MNIVFWFLIALPIVIWAMVRLVLPSVAFDMDFDKNHGTFLSILQQIFLIVQKVFWAGLVGGMAFRHFVGYGDAGMLLVASAVYSLLFNVWIITCYESYLHQRYPRTGSQGRSPYTASKYAATLALAASVIITFVLGVMLAYAEMPGK